MVVDNNTLENYIKLYDTGCSIHDIEPLENEHYKIFKLANTDVRIIDREKAIVPLIPLTRLAHFTNDHFGTDWETGEDKLIKGNRYFYMIPVQTVQGTIISFIFRRIFDRGPKNTRYYSLQIKKDNKLKINNYPYGFYKDFLSYDSDSKDGSKVIVVCEGVKDCIYLKQFYPYVLAMNGSSLGSTLHILKNITNNILFASDSDKAGLDAYSKDRYQGRQYLMSFGQLIFDKDIKDAASYINYPHLEKSFKDKLLNSIYRLENGLM